MIDRTPRSDVLFDVERNLSEIAEFLNKPDSGIGMFKWSIETNGVQVTDSYLEMLGEDKPELQEGILGLIHPSHRPRAAQEIRKAIFSGSERFESLYRMNDRPLQMFLFKGRILRRDDVPVGLFGLAIDVTSIPKLMLGIGKK